MNEGNINLKEWVRLDSIEDLLNSYNQRLLAQDLKISTLQTLVEELLSLQNSKHQNIDHDIELVNQKLNQLEDLAFLLQGNSSRMSCKDILINTKERIDHMEILVTSFATQSDTQTKLNKLNSDIQNSLVAIRSEMTPLELFDQLESAHLNTVMKLTTMESGLQCKVDKNDIQHVQVLASRLQKFNDFKDDSLTRLTTLEATTTKHSQDSLDHHETLIQLNNKVTVINSELMKLAPRSEVRVLAKELERHADLLDQTASDSSLQQMQLQVNQLLSTANIHEEDLKNIHNLLDTVKVELKQKANISEMRQCVLRSHFDEVILALGEAVDQKTPLTTTQNMQQEYQDLKKKVSEESSRINLTVRFIDWFTHRGEAYEHNIKIIDKHLKQLTDDIHPSERQPFGNLIRRQQQQQQRQHQNSQGGDMFEQL